MDPGRVAPSTRRPVSTVAAWTLGSAVAALVLLAHSRGEVRDMAFGDGLIYRYVAANMAIEPADVHPVVSERGTSLRYGRIGLPAAIWAGSGGRLPAMRYAHPAVIVVAAGAVSAAVAALVPGAGLLAPLLPFIAPGFPLSVIGGYAEVLAVALAAWAVVLASRHRWEWSSVMLAAAMLTRENAGAVLAGLLLWHVAVRRRARALILLASGIPLVAWYAVVRARFGHVPIFDPYLREVTDTIGPPLLATWRSVSSGAAAGIVTAAIHLAVALVGLALWRHSALGAVAAAESLQVMFAGPFAWRFAGDAVRASVFVELFVLLALARVRWGEEAATG